MASYYIKLYVSKTNITVLSLNSLDWVIRHDLGPIFIDYNAHLSHCREGSSPWKSPPSAHQRFKTILWSQDGFMLMNYLIPMLSSVTFTHKRGSHHTPLSVCNRNAACKWQVRQGYTVWMKRRRVTLLWKETAKHYLRQVKRNMNSDNSHWYRGSLTRCDLHGTLPSGLAPQNT